MFGSEPLSLLKKLLEDHQQVTVYVSAPHDHKYRSVFNPLGESTAPGSGEGARRLSQGRAGTGSEEAKRVTETY